MTLHIISIMDIQRMHTNNIAIMLIIQRFYAKYFIEFFFYQLSIIFRTIIFKEDILKMNNMRQPQFHFFVVFFYKTKPVINKKLKDLIGISKDIPSSTHLPSNGARKKLDV